MKTNIPFSTQERTEIIDEMIIQYMEAIFDMMEKVKDLIELKKEVSETH